jgi:UDP-N-acetylmuramyl pentapeptide phosphotransferase/UDP-N-acetylglucosamine-1-phosphate transferase
MFSKTKKRWIAGIMLPFLLLAAAFLISLLGATPTKIVNAVYFLSIVGTVLVVVFHKDQRQLTWKHKAAFAYIAVFQVLFLFSDPTYFLFRFPYPLMIQPFFYATEGWYRHNRCNPVYRPDCRFHIHCYCMASEIR